MIKIFSGRTLGIGLTDNPHEKTVWAQLDVEFREIIHEFPGAMLPVFLAIALHIDEYGICWPSYEALEENTGLSRRSIAGALNNLCKLKINGKNILFRANSKKAENDALSSNYYVVFPTSESLERLYDGKSYPKFTPCTYSKKYYRGKVESTKPLKYISRLN